MLIGGKSARFGNDFPKGIFKLNNKPILSHELEILLNFNHAIFLVANSQHQVDIFKSKIDLAPKIEVVYDDLKYLYDKTIRTPLIGLFSAFKELKKLNYRKIFALSCDLPLIKYEVIKLLIDLSEGYDCCIPKWESKNGYLEPLCAIYSIKKALKESKQNLQNQNYKLTNLISQSWHINYVSIEKTIQALDPNLLTFFNVNDPKDIERLKDLYANNH